MSKPWLRQPRDRLGRWGESSLGGFSDPSREESRSEARGPSQIDDIFDLLEAEPVSTEQDAIAIGELVSDEIELEMPPGVTGSEALRERRMATGRVLAKLRSVGGGFSFENRHATTASQIKVAANFLPTSWIEASNRDELPMVAVEHKHRGSVGSYNTRTGQISSSYGGSTQVMLHELGHRVQKSLALLGELEGEFYKRRRGKEHNHPLPGYPSFVEGIEDEFVDFYMGRWYGRPLSWEILPMGLEDVYYGKYNLIEKDPEYRFFILGLLAAV